MDMAGIKVNRNNEDSPRIRKLREAIKKQDKNLDTPAAQRMRQRTRVPDSISGKPPELRQGDPFKGSKKVPNFKSMLESWMRNVAVKPNIPKAIASLEELTAYIKKYRPYAEKELKKENMTPDDIGRITKNFIKERKRERKQISDEHGITSFRPKKRGGKVLANSTRKANYKAG